MAITMSGLESSLNTIKPKAALLQYGTSGTTAPVQFVNSAWNDIPLNFEIFDPYDLVTAPSTSWTQQPGTYIFQIQFMNSSTSAGDGYGAFRIINSSNSAELARTPRCIITGDAGPTRNFYNLICGCTLVAATTLKLQVITSTNNSRWETVTSQAADNKYLSLLISKID